MATDILGILSLLLALGGAGYLLWGRFMRRDGEAFAGQRVDAAAPPRMPAAEPSARAAKANSAPPAPPSSGPVAPIRSSAPPSSAPPSSAAPSSSAPPPSAVGAPPPAVSPPPPSRKSSPLPPSKPADAIATLAEIPELPESPPDSESPASMIPPSFSPPEDDEEMTGLGKLLKAPPVPTFAEPVPAQTTASAATPAPASTAASAATPAPAATPPPAKPAPAATPPPAKTSRSSEPDIDALAVAIAEGPDSMDLPRFNIDVEEDEELQPTKVGKVDRGSIRPAIDKILFDPDADVDEPLEDPPRLAVRALAQTDTGRRRKHNEDSFLLLEDDDVYVVADGMGGHRGGEYASKLAVKTIAGAFATKVFAAEAHTDVPLAASELARAMQMANTAIHEEAKRRPQLSGMGTTMVAVRFSADRRRMFVGHVGDSRCYRIRDGVMRQMTTDHTMAAYGVAGPEGAHLSRAVGVWPTVPIDIIMAKPELGDLYLICSDGLTRMIPDGTIATQLLHEEDFKAAIGRLVFFANAHGGKDNITVVLLRVVEAGASSHES